MTTLDAREQPIQFLDQLVFDCEELRACAADEFEDEMEPCAAACEQLANQFRLLTEDLQSGAIDPGTWIDQFCTDSAHELRRHLPVHGVLETVNRDMREGLGAGRYAVNPDVR